MARRPNKFGKREYKDDRDWVRYNEELVVRGTFYLDFSFADNWETELKKMNDGKRGGQYKYPDSFMQYLSVWHQWMDYRGLEGVARTLERQRIVLGSADYTTAWNRIHNFVPEIKLPSYRELNLATDGTGARARNSGRYLELKYGRKGRDKYVVVIITVDVKHKKLLKIEAHVEGRGPSEPEVAIKHGKELIGKGYKVNKFNGDGKYDTNDNFEFWHKHKTRCAIPPRSNAKIRSTKCNWRKHEIRKFRKLGYKRWRKTREYGDRLAAEGENSGVKREFGENLHSRNDDSLCAEAIQKFWAYDMLKSYGAMRM